MLHGDVYFVEKFVARMARQDILNARYWVYFEFKGFVEGMKVVDPTDSHVFLWYDEGSTDPIGATGGFEDTNFNQTVKFIFEKFELEMGNWICS